MTTRINGWCACGASFSVAVANEQSDVARSIADAFRGIHHGEECRPCDAQEAANARRRIERQQESKRRREGAA